MSIRFEQLEEQACINYMLEGNKSKDLQKLCAVDAGMKFLQEGNNVNQSGTDGNTPIMTLSEIGSVEMVKEFVEAGADVNILDDINNYALLNAAEQKHQDVFDYLLPITIPLLRKQAVDIMSHGSAFLLEQKQGTQAKIKLEILIAAAFEGQENKIVRTINQGVYVNDLGADGQSALHKAVLGKQLSSVKTLLKYNAYPKVVNKQGLTPIDIAISSEILKELIKSKVSFKDLQENFFNHYRELGFNGEKLWTKVIEGSAMALLQETPKPNLNQASDGGDTPLMNLASIGCLELIQQYVHLGADPDILDETNSYPLLEAANQGRAEVFEFLLPLTTPELRKKPREQLLIGITHFQKRLSMPYQNQKSYKI
jgi:ankyrin repeat protein